MTSSRHPISSSSPPRSTSKRVESDHYTPPVSTQVDLQRLVSEEIHDHAWEFNSKRIAAMLSATGKGPLDALVNSACEALGRKTPPV